jgi:hypothetical protein
MDNICLSQYIRSIPLLCTPEYQGSDSYCDAECLYTRLMLVYCLQVTKSPFSNSTPTLWHRNWRFEHSRNVTFTSTINLISNISYTHISVMNMN